MVSPLYWPLLKTTLVTSIPRPKRRPCKSKVQKAEALTVTYYFKNFGEKCFLSPKSEARKALFWLLDKHGILSRRQIAERYGYKRCHVAKFINEFETDTEIRNALFRIDYGNNPF